MTTLVGTQEHFHDALYELCELDYDAIEAYEAAINRLDNADYRTKLTEFKNDHQRHVQEITSLLKSHQAKVPDGPSAKQLLAQGKVVLANMFGDEAILKAMLSNEVDTNTAYERMNSHKNKWPEAAEILSRGWNDEKRHKQWLDAIINTAK
ncbi:Uncharacterized conserved protein [Legionella beliardensis]|uniref:Uncharacterized conserved protein n=1 Tax=Legionella beliardensis TaxID=91822 RepID=A0A378I438_9GAMM|nr:DUF892 family protein [Legionella beliardensis]STX29520.1 Uncharacterized conserved protein [Legionella beliardensis]